MYILYVCVYVIPFSLQPFIQSTSHLAGFIAGDPKKCSSECERVVAGRARFSRTLQATGPFQTGGRVAEEPRNESGVTLFESSMFKYYSVHKVNKL